MATKTRAKAKRKKTTVTKTARRRKTVRKTRVIRKKAAKEAPPPRKRHAPTPSRPQRSRSSRRQSAHVHSLKQASRRGAGLHGLLRRSTASAS
jgi:hypothetical protein